MKVRRHSDSYNFIGDTTTGITFRWGQSLDDDPIVAPWPELADISISNHCTNSCDYCYRDSGNNYSFISVDNYRYILKSLGHPYWGNVFQVALGGGEPLEHPNFLELVSITNELGIVVNFTTNGIHLTRQVTESLIGRVGAIAISIYDIGQLEAKNLSLLLDSGIKMNIHFLLSKNTLSQAIQILHGDYNHILKDVNAIIYLTYKPFGRGKYSECLSWNNELMSFVRLTEDHECAVNIGIDACLVPLLLHLTCIDIQLVDPCECGYFSVYVDEEMNVKPCSFANDRRYTYNLREYTFSDVWENRFTQYRETARVLCRRDCKNHTSCTRSCPFYENVNLCFSAVKSAPLEL